MPVKGGARSNSTQKKAASSAEVARLAGVSRSAVSRTYTPGAYVSPETREKVLAAAEMLSYRPNAIARSLSKRSSRLIGIVANDLDNSFYAQMLAMLTKDLQRRGYGILLLTSNELEDADGLIPELLDYQVDGVVLPAATIGAGIAIELQRLGTPVVLINRHLRSDAVSSVTGDNIASGAEIAELLVATGHRRIAYLAGHRDSDTVPDDRGLSFREVLAKYGMAIHARGVGGYHRDAATAAARKMLSTDPPPDAIFCANDAMALAALDVARLEFKIDVPRDLAVVGYDNSEPAAWPYYELTSVDQDLPEMSRIAVDLLMDKLAGRQTGNAHLVVPGKLIERATTRRRRKA
jgi:DNA-binding LacI/PurR family transcriptional regulator